MPIEVKHGKLYMKDASGNLVQIVPEASSAVPDYQGATASASGVSGLVPAAQSADRSKFLRADGTWAPAGTGVRQAYTEVESITETETDSVQPEGTLTASDDYAGRYINASFQITLFGTLNGEPYSLTQIDTPSSSAHFWFGYFLDENGTAVGSDSDYDTSTSTFSNPIRAAANTRYCATFSINPEAVISEAGIAFVGCAFYGENGVKEPIGNTLIIAGSEFHPDLQYESGSHTTISNPTIALTFPAVGESITLNFNAWQNLCNDSSIKYGIITGDLNKSITIENIDGENFRLCFFWDTSKDVEVETTRKELKTIVEMEDDTSVSASKPLSGLLQNLSMNVESSTAIETVNAAGKPYYSVVYLGEDDTI